MMGECDDGDIDFFDIVIDWGEWGWWYFDFFDIVTEWGEDWVYCNRNKIKWSVILISLSKMLFVVLDL